MVTLPTTWWLSTAPSTETPIEPPIERKNATTELAAPMSRWAVLFCTDEHEVLHGRAEAEAEHRHEDADADQARPASMVLSSDRPTMTSTMPPTR